MNWSIFLNITTTLFSRGYFVNPFLIYAQAVHETTNFTSNIFNENKNLFGMKRATVRETTNVGENRGHAMYTSIKDSIIDYYLRQTYSHFDIKAQMFNSEQYMEDTFNSNYAEDSQYISKWRNHYKKILSKNLYLGLIFILVPFSLIIYFIYKAVKS